MLEVQKICKLGKEISQKPPRSADGVNFIQHKFSKLSGKREWSTTFRQEDFGFSSLLMTGIWSTDYFRS